MPPTPSRLLLGEYEVVRPIASGGMGAVLEVRSQRTGASYAAKTILKAQDKEARERFRREAELLARCDRHPGIVKVHAFGEAPDGSPCMILDLVRGEGLEKLIEREGRLEPRRAAEIASDLAAALAFCHERGIVHRDVKPSNVLLEGGTKVRLTDFGLAVARDVERLTRTGIFVGTLQYAAPEQAIAAKGRTGSWSDVWSAGALLFHLLAGEPPIVSDSPLGVLALLHDPRPVRDVRDLAPEVPEPLAAIVARALSKPTANRYANGAELAQDLERFLTGQPTRASASALRAARARRRLPLLVSAVALVLVAVAGVGVTLGVRANARARVLADLDASVAKAQELAQKAARTREPAAEPPARAELEKAREALARARQPGPGSDGLAPDVVAPRRAALDGVAGDLAVLEAERDLARGEPAKALAVLGAAPAAGSLALEATIARGRALAATGRAGEAVPLLEGVVSTVPAARRSEACEALGDALAARGDWARAETSYGEAAQGHKTTELRAKHCGAAAAAGHDAAASAELAQLLPDRDRDALPQDRKANERLSALAPALYARALAPTATNRARESDLEAAWRLAPPPEVQRAKVVAQLIALSKAEGTGSAGTFFRNKVSDEELDRVRLAIRLLARARALDPSIDVGCLWDQFQGLALWAHSVSREETERVVSKFLLEWPDHPSLLLQLAQAKRGSVAEQDDLFKRAYRALGDLGPGSHAEELRVALVLLGGVAVRFDLASGEAARELPRVRRLAENADRAEGWFALAELEVRTGDLAAARADLARGEAAPFGEEKRLIPRRTLEVQILLLEAEGKPEEAIAATRRFIADHPDDATGPAHLAGVLYRQKRLDEVTALAGSRVATTKDDILLHTVAAAWIDLGKLDEAERVLERLHEIGSLDHEAEVRGLLEAKRGAGKK